MKEGWTYKKLGDIAEFSRGLTYSKHDEVDSSENVVLRSNNIDLLAGKLDFSELKYIKQEFQIPDEKRLKKGSLFICMSNGSKAHLGKVAYIDKDYNYAFGGFMGQISPIKDVDGKYLYYALSSPQYKLYIKDLSAGANINNLKIKDLELFEIHIAPYEEQQRIVSRLDSAFSHIDELKANAEKQLSEARALFQKSLAKAMEPKEGWEETPLNKISNYSIGLTYKPQDVSDNGTIVLRSSNIQNDKLDLSDIVRVSCPIKGTLYVQAGDILMCSRNGSAKLVGKVTVIPKLKERMTYGTFMMIIRGDYNPYLFYFFKSDDFRNQIKHGEANMINQITRYMLNDVVVNVPPKSEVKQIVERLDALSAHVRELEENQKKIISECDALKQALLRKVFE